MAFPASDRVIYQRNPLEDVVCQVRFPAILKIANAPDDFQEEIRKEFPLVSQKPAIDFPLDMPPEMLQMFASKAGTIYQFLTRDKAWTVSLFREFLALNCESYRRWEDFRGHFVGPFEALKKIYAPAFFSRIGLRYRNVIRRDVLGLADVPWPKLLRPEICGELSADAIGSRVEQATRETVLDLGNGAKARLTHWLVVQENAYVIDADFFIDAEVETENVYSQLDAFNEESSRLFRWAITDTLDSAMGPQPV